MQLQLIRMHSFNNTSDGYLLMQIGNYDSGEFILEYPIRFALSQDGKLFALDNESLIVFDQYGLGLVKFNTGNTASITIVIMAS